MKLYVSDLDGTLLNSNQQITDFSKDQLNKLINQGVNITIATARSPATVVDILEGLNLILPVVLMNGVLVFDLKRKEYIDIKSLNKDIVHKALDIFQEYNKNPLCYGIRDNHLWVFHKDFANHSEEKFYLERVDKPLKTFLKVEDYKITIEDAEVINFIIFDKKETVIEIYNELRKIEGLTVNHYEDIYSDLYFLEAYSSNASKAMGIKKLSNYVESEELITFGDNINDIPMFEISDVSYAMGNGANELREIATEIIGVNNEDAVVKKIIELENVKC